MTWAALTGGRVGSCGLNPHFVPPQLVEAVLRDIDRNYGLVERPSVRLTRADQGIDYGGAAMAGEPSVRLALGGARAVVVMTHQKALLLDQLRRRLAVEPRSSGSRWPWVKLHTWPGRCVVLYLSEAVRLEAGLSGQGEEALRLGEELRNRRLAARLSGIPNVVLP